MKVSTKLIAGFGLLIGLLVLVMVYHVSTLRESVRTSRQLSSMVTRVTVSSTEQLQRLDQMQESASKYAVTGDTGYSAAFARARADYGDALAGLDSLPLTGGERQAVDRLTTLWRHRFPPERTLEGMINGLAAPEADAVLGWLDASLGDLRRRTRALTEASQAAMQERVQATTEAARNAERVSGAAVGVALLLSVLLAGFIVRSITESLRRLKEGTRAVAEGDFAYRLDLDQEDEFADLAGDFNVMTRRLGELDRAKRGFLSQVSHDLKTPLASMQETTQLLLARLPGELNEKQVRFLELNRRSGARLSAMISRLLDLSRLEEGALEYDFRTGDLASLIRFVTDDFDVRLEERSIRIDTDLPADGMPIRCDGDRIVEVIENLLDNAVKYAPAGSRIGVRLTRVEEAPPGAPPVEPHQEGEGVPAARSALALLTVSDEGPGIPEEEKSRVFERFHRAPNARSHDGSGVGLGLALCREIVGAHRGAIWVEDREPRGSVFCVLLPLGVRRTIGHPVAATGGPT
ncbi:MAG: HAMP domain-containing sensor histidine kinase [Candidatus Palauibacterales bacterium]|nr:HAMP domain-containing sensor histidine kinase [Candidatus Palauibacterales bacterium]